MKSFAALQFAARRLHGEPYAVDRPVDEHGQYQLELAADFPFAIKRLRFVANQPPPLTWHTYLEIFVMLSSECSVQMGAAVVRLKRGDVLVMDHQKLHAVLNFPGAEAEAVVIRFLPEMVRSPGSAASDHLLLLPFYCQVEERAHVVRGNEPAASAIHATLASLFECYASADRTQYWQTGSRGYFLVTLHHLARRFEAAERLKDLFDGQKPKQGRLREVFEFIAVHYAGRITLPQIAALAGLSRPRFHTVFKKAAGMTLVDYLTRVRLTHAARLLQETERPIVDIAHVVGFADQSYFDRRFRRHFGRTPQQFRKGPLASTSGAGPRGNFNANSPD